LSELSWDIGFLVSFTRGRQWPDGPILDERDDGLGRRSLDHHAHESKESVSRRPGGSIRKEQNILPFASFIRVEMNIDWSREAARK
jgi:hypothetical protein